MWGDWEGVKLTIYISQYLICSCNCHSSSLKLHILEMSCIKKQALRMGLHTIWTFSGPSSEYIRKNIPTGNRKGRICFSVFFWGRKIRKINVCYFFLKLSIYESQFDRHWTSRYVTFFLSGMLIIRRAWGSLEMWWLWSVHRKETVVYRMYMTNWALFSIHLPCPPQEC